MYFKNLKIGDKFQFNTGDSYVDMLIYIKTGNRTYVLSPDGNVSHKVGTINVKVVKL
jgi:hypothetical protein